MLEQFGLVPCPGWLWSHHLRESCLVCVICRILGMTFEDVSLRVLSLIIDVFALVLSSSITLTDIDVRGCVGVGAVLTMKLDGSGLSTIPCFREALTSL